MGKSTELFWCAKLYSLTRELLDLASLPADETDFFYDAHRGVLLSTAITSLEQHINPDGHPVDDDRWGHGIDLAHDIRLRMPVQSIRSGLRDLIDHFGTGGTDPVCWANFHVSGAIPDHFQVREYRWNQRPPEAALEKLSKGLAMLEWISGRREQPPGLIPTHVSNITAESPEKSAQPTAQNRSWDKNGEAAAKAYLEHCQERWDRDERPDSLKDFCDVFAEKLPICGRTLADKLTAHRHKWDPDGRYKARRATPPESAQS